MVSKYGMSDELGPVVYSDDNNEVFLGRDYGHVNNYSDVTSARIDAEIEKMMRTAYEKTENILKEHYDKLELIAETLIEKEKISGADFVSLMEKGYIEESDEDAVESDVVNTAQAPADASAEAAEVVEVNNDSTTDVSISDE